MSKATFAKQYRLLSMPHAQCRVYIKRFDDGSVSVELISYETSVLILNYNPEVGAALYCSGTYSTTTARHINRFTREFCGDNKYHECKAALHNPDKLFAFGWYHVCDVDPECLIRMCNLYEWDARKEYHDYFTGNTTVPGELITRKQRDSMFRYLSDNCFEKVRVKRTQTYWCFGVRFPFSDAEVEVL